MAEMPVSDGSTGEMHGAGIPKALELRIPMQIRMCKPDQNRRTQAHAPYQQQPPVGAGGVDLIDPKPSVEGSS